MATRIGRVRSGIPPEPPTGQAELAVPPADPAAQPADPAESAVPLSGLGSPAAD